MPTKKPYYEVLGLQEIAKTLEVDARTPHAWLYRKVLPPHDHESVNGLRAWNRSTIIEWAARTGRLPKSLRGETPLPVASERGGQEARYENMLALVDAGLLRKKDLPEPPPDWQATA